MKLSDLGEFGFIERIAEACRSDDPSRVVQGIGDDAAVTRISRDRLQLVTTDLLVEGVHFEPATIAPDQLGAKALTVNLSDIAAMGGIPLDAFVALAIPSHMPVSALDALYSGMRRMAAESGTRVLGGDTTASPSGLFLAVTVVGEVPADQVLLRSAARVGDRILVTGNLGDSAGGLRVLTTAPTIPSPVAGALVRAHLEPQPRLAEGRCAAESSHGHAAIDLSDGLASDLGHVCRASRVGARIDRDRIPVSEELRQLCRATGTDPLALALGGGEDYQLLLTVAPEGAQALRRSLADTAGCTAHDIGEITDGDSILLCGPDGTAEAVHASGWDHFKTAD